MMADSSDEWIPLLSRKSVPQKIWENMFLYFSAFSLGLTVISAQCFVVWTSPALMTLLSNDTSINPLGEPITTYQTSVLAGMLAIGNMMAPFFLNCMLDKQGRKTTLQILSAATCLATLLIAFTENFYLYCLSRGITGLTMGACLIAVPIYISEITEDHNRGSVGVLMGIFVPLGSMYGYIVGPAVSLKWFTLLCCLPVAVNMLVMGIFLPDSPVHLLSIGEGQKALDALRQLRNKTGNAERDLFEMTKQLNDCHIEHKGFASLIRNKQFKMGFFIVLGVKLASDFSGMFVVSGFIGPIFSEANIGISGHTIGICMASVQIITLILITSIIRKVGRRVLLLLSTLGSSICLSLVGLYFYLKEKHVQNLESVTWLPVVGVVIYYIAFSIGLGCVPKILLSEMFPNNVRSTAVSVISFIVSIFFFCNTFAFPILRESFGTSFCFCSYAAFTFISFWFIYFVVPETKGRNLMEI